MTNNETPATTTYIVHPDGSVHLTHVDAFGIVTDMAIDPATAFNLAGDINRLNDNRLND